MIAIPYTACLILCTVVWIIWRKLTERRNHWIDWEYETRLMIVYLCIIVIAGVVFFTWDGASGSMGYLLFDPDRILPFKINLEPFNSMRHGYAGWQQNLWGNIELFIPVGMAWPYCFKKLDRIGKVVLAGMGFSLCIELLQLFFYERRTDIDDFFANSIGTLIGAVLYFIIDYFVKRGNNGK